MATWVRNSLFRGYVVCEGTLLHYVEEQLHTTNTSKIVSILNIFLELFKFVALIKTKLLTYFHLWVTHTACICLGKHACVFFHELFLHMFMPTRESLSHFQSGPGGIPTIKRFCLCEGTNDWWQSLDRKFSLYCCFLLHVIFFISSMFCVMC